jgi:hypothetical protein
MLFKKVLLAAGDEVQLQVVPHSQETGNSRGLFYQSTGTGALNLRFEEDCRLHVCAAGRLHPAEPFPFTEEQAPGGVDSFGPSRWALPDPEAQLRARAIAVSILYARYQQSQRSILPARLMSGWHRDSRRLSQWEYGGLSGVQTCGND